MTCSGQQDRALQIATSAGCNNPSVAVRVGLCPVAASTSCRVFPKFRLDSCRQNSISRESVELNLENYSIR